MDLLDEFRATHIIAKQMDIEAFRSYARVRLYCIRLGCCLSPPPPAATSWVCQGANVPPIHNDVSRSDMSAGPALRLLRLNVHRVAFEVE